MQEIVVVDRVTKVYPSGVAANVDVSLKACSGEVLCIMGPNGAGKTTLIRQIVGILRPTSGTVRVFGVDPVKHQDYVKRRVAYVPQLPIYYPAHRVVEVAKYVAELSGTHLDRVREVLEALDLWRVRDALGYQLSAGQRKLLLVALALIKGGDLLVLDEPTSFVDFLKKRVIWSTLLRERAGKTMIVVSHDIEEVRILCDRVYIMFAGRVVGRVDAQSDLSRGVEVRVYYRDPREVASLVRRGVTKVFEGFVAASYRQLADALEDLESLAASELSREARIVLEYPSMEYIVETLSGKG